MQSWSSFIDRLIRDLDAIEVDLLSLLEISEIRYEDPNPPGSGVIMVAPDYGWGPSDEAQTLARVALRRAFDSWRGRSRVLEEGATPELRHEIGEALTLVEEWIDRSGWGWSIPPTIAEATTKAGDHIERARAALRVLGAAGVGGVHLVPDTSALMRQPELSAYGSAAGVERAVIHLVPTVLRELDLLKDQGRTEEVRSKAAGIVRRIKGLRDRGRLIDGVKVAGDISAIADPKSPSFGGLPEWLDPATPDDQILASALQIQARNPSAVVILVVADMNLQNKADAIGLPFVEPDQPPAPGTAG